MLKDDEVRKTNSANGAQGTRVNLVSIGLLIALIAANVFLTLPPRTALSDSKNPDLKPAPRREAQRAAPSRKPEDFGAETVEPLKGEVLPLPVEEVEEPQRGEKSPAAPAAGEDSATGSIPPEVAAGGGEADQSVTTVLNGNEIEIAVLVKTFSKLTKRNYIVDNNVKGKVAIHVATPVSVPEALRIFESVLLLKGFTTVPLGDNTWKVIAAKDAKQTTIPMLGEAPDSASDALVTELIRLKNTQASELQQVLQQFVSKDGMINAFGATNALILIDSAANIKRLKELVAQLDVPAVDQDITIIPILHADAKDVAEKINSILGEKDDANQEPATTVGRNIRNPAIPNIPVRPGQPAAPSTAGGVTTTGERRTLPLKLIPDDRTNSLICVADAMLTQKVRALAEQLDSPVNRSGGKFYVYRLQHADAEEVAQILNAVISGEGSSGGSSSTGGSGTSGSNRSLSSSRSNRNSESGFGLDQTGQTSRRDQLAQAVRQSGVFGARLNEGDGGKVNLEGEVTVAADTSTNSLVINAGKSDYEKIKELIDLLDVKRRQVLVEATILEVSLTKNEGMGIEWQTSGGTDEAGAIAQTNFGGISNLLANPTALSDLTIAAASSGSIVLPGGITLPSQAILITALSRNQNVNVLSTPTILAIDNQEAEIKVGENVPFVTSTSTNQTNLNNTFNQIERQDVGIKLRITPQISAGDFVVLKIFVEISNVVPGTRNDPNGPTTTIRTTETVVEVKSDQMVVTGGLIADSVTDSSRGVPFFEDIPVLGNLFRRDDNERRRNNLLVFITPRIISDQFVAREQTMVKRDKMEKTIYEQGAEPERQETLRSDDIDRVVDAQPLSPDQPTTVTPPREARAMAPQGASDATVELLATQRTQERIRALAAGEPPGEPRGDAPMIDEEIEVEVQPVLPGESKPAAKNTARGSLRSSAESLPPAAAGKTFVVLRETAQSGKPVPFNYSANKTLVVVLQGSGREFFRTGNRYSFKSGESAAKYVCLGTYDSSSDAQSSHPELGDSKKWYTIQESALSPSGWSQG